MSEFDLKEKLYEYTADAVTKINEYHLIDCMAGLDCDGVDSIRLLPLRMMLVGGNMGVIKGNRIMRITNNVVGVVLSSNNRRIIIEIAIPATAYFWDMYDGSDWPSVLIDRSTNDDRFKFLIDLLNIVEL